MSVFVRHKELVRWLLAVLIVAVFAWFSKVFTRDVNRLATFWLANGLVLGLLLCAPERRWRSTLLAGFVGNVLGGLFARDPLLPSLSIAGFNFIEVVAAAALLRKARGVDAPSPADLSQPRFFWRFAVAALVVAPLVSGLLVTGYAALRDGMFNSSRLGVWYIAHALGMGIMVPATLAFQGDAVRLLFQRRGALEKLLSLAMVVGVTCFVFSADTYPLLFLLFPPLLLTALRGGFAATATSLLIVALIAVGFTNEGLGPLNMIPDASLTRFLILDVFLGVLMLTLFPVALVLAERRRALDAAHDSELRYRMLAEHSQDVILLADAQRRAVYVSPAVQEVFGWSPEEFLRLDYRAIVHPEDFATWSAATDKPDPARDRVTQVYRVYRRDGVLIWIESQIAMFRDKDFARAMGIDPKATLPTTPRATAGGFQGRVVTLRDVTRRRIAEQHLEAANLELASLVWKDGLTGLSNRRRLDEFLESEWQRAVRSNEPLAVILIDVDHFKSYNDCYGHQQGDHCLIAVSAAIASGLNRPADLAARYGGEEFAVVLPNTSLAQARMVAERIRTNVLGARLTHAGSPLGVVTVSLGVAGCQALPSQSEDDLVAAADKALYRSKESGRNTSTAVLLPAPLLLPLLRAGN